MKRPIAICLILILSACLAGCGKKEAATEASVSENMIHLYQVDENQIVLAGDDYQLKTPDVVSACVEDVMAKLTELSSSRIASYTYMLMEDNALQLDLMVKDGTYTQEDILLLTSAVTKTLFQLDGIDEIELSLKDSMGAITEAQTFLKSSFYYYDSEETSLLEDDISLYVPNDQGAALKKVVVKETTSPEISDQELIVRELVKMGVLPQGTKVNQVSVYGTVCYLDLSGEFLYSVGNSSPDLTLYALVDSVIAQTGIETVQILVDGELENTYRNVADISQPISFNSNLLEEN